MRYCFTLDLIDNEENIREYEKIHTAVWPEIISSIKEAGITVMDIYRAGNRLFMIMETTADFSFEKKEMLDHSNPIVRKWENLMWQYQQAIPGAKPGEKWVLMKQIFSLPS